MSKRRSEEERRIRAFRLFTPLRKRKSLSRRWAHRRLLLALSVIRKGTEVLDEMSKA